MPGRARNSLVAVCLLLAAVGLLGYAFWARSRDQYTPRLLGPTHYERKAFHEEPRTQCESIELLARTEGVRALPTLLEKLQSTQDEVVAVTARCLAQYGGKQAVQPLAAQLQRNSTIVKFAVVKALETIADPAALSALKSQVTPESPVASDAAWAIGRLKDPATGRIPREAEDALISYLNSPMPRVRMGAILGLADGGTERALQPLRQLAADPLKGLDPDILSRPAAEGRPPDPSILANPCGQAIRAIEQRLTKPGAAL